jgi:glycosyltransferase involved in cell wall biosynthesis
VKVLVQPADTDGCGNYRLIWPARACGIDVLLPGEQFIDAVFVDTDDGPRVIDIASAPECDVLVMQRALHRNTADMIPHLQRHGIAVVIDVDDDFSCIHPQNTAHDVYDPALNPDRNWRHLLRACEQADLVTVSTPALARRYGKAGNATVLPNCIPAHYLYEHSRRIAEGRGENPLTKLRIGWSGSTHTHPGDLETTGGAVGAVIRARGSSTVFHTIGTAEGVKAALGLPSASSRTGWVPIVMYPTAVAQLDVGIVPLQANAFNRAKSWLKGLEMAALGVPFVASPLPEYARLAHLGAGLLAARPQDWEREVGRLVGSPALRDDYRARGLDVARQWTIERHAGRWADAWHGARRQVAA